MAIDQKKVLKTRAHALKPVVWLGQEGLTPGVLSEVELALETHELIKIKIPGIDREERKVIVTQIVMETLSELVQLLGQIATIYRKKEKENVPANPPKKTQKKR